MANEGPQASRVGKITVSSGSGTLTLTNEWSTARWIRVKPVNETDTFTLTIADADGMIMGKWTGQLGTFSAELNMSLGIMSTISIASASSDGTYTVKFDLA